MNRKPLDAALLDEFEATIQREQRTVHGVVVYQTGRGQISRRWSPDERVHLFSASKTVTALAIGILLDRQLISLEDPLLSYFPEFLRLAQPGLEQVTVKHLLQMTSGKAAFLFQQEPDDTTRDYAEVFFSEALLTPPGERFYYANINTYMLSRLVEKVSGQVLVDFLSRTLFEPLGVTAPRWDTCPGGHSMGSSRLWLRTAELARIGQLMLEQGSWQGRTLISAQYLEALATDTVPSRLILHEPEVVQGYGYQIWRGTHPGSYRADGLYGQFLMIFPREQAVIALTAHDTVKPYDLVRFAVRDILSRLD